MDGILYHGDSTNFINTPISIDLKLRQANDSYVSYI